jgi:uncharacterized membrane protein
MAFCGKCGAAVADNASFCAACGAPQSSTPSEGRGPASTGAPAQTPMAENVAGLLCYALGWITGLIFYFVDKRPYVRFHATQSIVLFGGLHLLLFIWGVFFGISLVAGGWAGFSVGYAVHSLIWLGACILWIVLMIKAYQGARFRVPLAADIAEKMFGKV